MLDLLISSISASNSHNNTGKRNKNYAKTAIWKRDLQPCKIVLSLEFANIIIIYLSWSWATC
jgi:hypothetical protein